MSEMRTLLEKWSHNIEMTGVFSGNEEVKSGLKEVSVKFQQAAEHITEEIDVARVLGALNCIFHFLQLHHLDTYQENAVRERAIVFNLIKVAKCLPACAESEEFVQNMENLPNYSMECKFIIALEVVKLAFEEALKMILEPLDDQADPELLISSDVYHPNLLEFCKNCAEKFSNFDKELLLAAEKIEQQETNMETVVSTLTLTYETLFDSTQYKIWNGNDVQVSKLHADFLEIVLTLVPFCENFEAFQDLMETALKEHPEINGSAGIEVKDVEKALWIWIGQLMG